MLVFTAAGKLLRIVLTVICALAGASERVRASECFVGLICVARFQYGTPSAKITPAESLQC
jgi:hypothetical protein